MGVQVATILMEMDNPVKIGPELTKFGSKPVHQLGFGHEKHIEHSRHAWLEAHLERPSRWDVGVPKPFKDLTKMPNFYLSKPEIQKILHLCSWFSRR
jgi:hypothetical protein